MLTPFVKLRAGTQLFSIGHCTFFVSETHSKWSQNYSVSESGGAPTWSKLFELYQDAEPKELFLFG